MSKIQNTDENRPKGLFDGYEQRAGQSYQIRRVEERNITDKNARARFLEYERLVDEGYELTVEDSKRYNSLKERFLIRKKRDISSEVFIPFREDYKTIYYIREKNCFKPKWVKKFGKRFITNRIKMYKEILHLKPENIYYWNPF